jgi:hypothetical protein
MIKFLTIFSLFSLNLGAQTLNNKQFTKFLSILARVESGGKTNAIGDGGKAIGIYQIHYSCWQDTTNKLNGKYENCFDPEYAGKVVSVYLSRYCKGNNDMESWARCWNSGPNWRNKYHLTNKYVERFNKLSK